jgi:hypothetical protein
MMNLQDDWEIWKVSAVAHCSSISQLPFPFSLYSLLLGVRIVRNLPSWTFWSCHRYQTRNNSLKIFFENSSKIV